MKILISIYKALFCFLATMFLVVSNATAQVNPNTVNPFFIEGATFTSEDQDLDSRLDAVNEDLDGDGLLDVGEAFIDANNNGIWDDAVAAVVGDNPATPQIETNFLISAAVPAELYTDINGNGVYDSTEVDINDNGTADIYVEQYVDSNFNGSWDAGEVLTLDANQNGLWDPGDTFIDAGNGVWDAAEAFLDANGNVVANHVDHNGDGIINNAVGFADEFADVDGDGSYDAAEVLTFDLDNDGVFDAQFIEDFDLDGNQDFASEDIDLDGNVDVVEDDDNDAVIDYTLTYEYEVTNGTYDAEPFLDANGNVVANHVDANNNNIVDGDEFQDLDGNGVWTTEAFDDLNGNGVYDVAGEVLTTDNDGDGEFDAAEPYADTNNNGQYDLGEFFVDLDGDTLYTDADIFADADGDGVWDAPEQFEDTNVLTEVEFVTEGTFNFESAGLTHNDVDLIDADELATSLAPLQADIATNAADIATNAANIATNAANIATNAADIQVNRDGVAMAAAISHSTILPGMTQALDISHASFEGSSAMSINYSRKVKEGVQVNLSHASAGDSHINKVGVGFQW